MCWNKGRLCRKIAKLFYFCHLKKLVRPETFGPYYVYITGTPPQCYVTSTLPVLFNSELERAWQEEILSYNEVLPGKIQDKNKYKIRAEDKIFKRRRHQIAERLHQKLGVTGIACLHVSMYVHIYIYTMYVYPICEHLNDTQTCTLLQCTVQRHTGCSHATASSRYLLQGTL